MVYFDQILHTSTFLLCLDIGMQNGDETLLSISPVGHGQLVKTLINLELHRIFGSNFAYLYILTLCGHWYANRG